jgi:alpha-beta hydrolase superfamily lysophospholipase
MPINPVKYYLGRALAPLLPSLCIPSGLLLSNLSRDPTVVQNYKNDPMTHNVISLATGISSSAGSTVI